MLSRHFGYWVRELSKILLSSFYPTVIRFGENFLPSKVSAVSRVDIPCILVRSQNCAIQKDTDLKVLCNIWFWTPNSPKAINVNTERVIWISEFICFRPSSLILGRQWTGPSMDASYLSPVFHRFLSQRMNYYVIYRELLSINWKIIRSLLGSK